jgi:hypothetical protein
VSGGEAPILADDSGRRRRRLRALGRVLTGLLILWLGILGLGALGLQPLGGLPVLGLTPDRAAPSELPARIQAAVRTHRVIALSSSVRGLPPADTPRADAGSPTPSVRQGGPATGRSPRNKATPGGSHVVLPDVKTPPVGSQVPGGLGTAPAPTTPVAPGRSGTTPTRPVPPGRSGTTPAPARSGRPEQPGRSEATPTQPAPPAHGAPTDPRSIATGPPVTTPPS